ncbi:MAG: hypothetical protein LLF76_11055 [Planctomycetaceae bacterium]|nr:hypothetical protein [Planctomycetaceae bacterium]
MNSCGPEAVAPIWAGCVAIFAIVVGLCVLVITVLAFCKIFGKAGYPWALGLIVLVPLGNIIMLLVLAFSEWPIQRQLRECQRGGTNPPAPGQHENFRTL